MIKKYKNVNLKVYITKQYLIIGLHSESMNKVNEHFIVIIPSSTMIHWVCGCYDFMNGSNLSVLELSVLDGNYFYRIKSKVSDLSRSQPEGSFSIVTTLKCRGGYYIFSLYP